MDLLSDSRQHTRFFFPVREKRNTILRKVESADLKSIVCARVSMRTSNRHFVPALAQTTGKEIHAPSAAATLWRKHVGHVQNLHRVVASFIHASSFSP